MRNAGPIPPGGTVSPRTMLVEAVQAAPPPPRSGITLLVDARALWTSGIGRYLREVLAHLLQDPRFARTTLLGDPEALREFVAGLNPAGEVRIEAYPGGFYSVRTQLAWLLRAARGANAADVVFFPHYDAPLLARPRRRVVTVHDLTHFKAPEGFAWWRRAAAAVLLRRAVSGAARVIAVSEVTRRDLVEQVPRTAAVEVIPNGVDPVFHLELALDDEPPALFSQFAPFLLCVGNRKPHKNLVAAVETLALLRPERPNLRLAFAGRVFPGWERVLARAEQLGIRDSIIDLQKVTDEELRWLYANCEALLFPSLYEGFGLPVIEAMACGAPVIASNRASLPEVVGDAGLLVNPDDYPTMAAAFLRLSDGSPFRAELISRGKERSRRFTWTSSVREAALVLTEAANGQPESAAERLDSHARALPSEATAPLPLR